MHLDNPALSALGSQRPDHHVYSLGKKAPAAPAGGSASAGSSPTISTAQAVNLNLSEAEPLTLDGLRRAWGTDDPRYDLNRDGNVSMPDMLSLLASMRGETNAGNASATPDASLPQLADALQTMKGNAGDGPPSPLTLEGLLEAWGKADERYDFNGDGAVNMPDLLKMLAKLSAPRETPEKADVAPPVTGGKTGEVAAATSPTPVEEEAPVDPKAVVGGEAPAEENATEEPLTVEGLMEVWGKADDRYDLNEDGTVNMEDLLTLLARLRGEPASEPGASGSAPLSAEAPPTISTEGPGGEEEPPAPLTLEGLMEVWGKASDQYDFNQDGVVGMEDLLTMLSRMGPGSEGNGVPPTGNATALASSIMDELKSGGFNEQPPVNLHQLIGTLNLDSSLEKQLIEHLSKEYPSGLGLNVKG